MHSHPALRGHNVRPVFAGPARAMTERNLDDSVSVFRCRMLASSLPSSSPTSPFPPFLPLISLLPSSLTPACAVASAPKLPIVRTQPRPDQQQRLDA
jgi:hypothetical protein